MDGTKQSRVAVVVPAFNEARLILGTLKSLQEQRFDGVFHQDVLGGFRIIVVDNGSTDNTVGLVEEFIASKPPVPVELIAEAEKGTGCACDTGFRHAIDSGALYVARTDADALPDGDWLSEILAPLVAGRRLVGGRVRARLDEGFRSTVFNAVGVLWRVGHVIDWFRTRNEPDSERRSFAVCGNNMAIDSEMYIESGGFPRGAIERVDEDHVLQTRVRAITGAAGIGLAKNAVVYMSLRRLNAYGVRDFHSWYNDTDRRASGRAADIR
ncbi:glycosyltransferase family 2 protein [Gordonia bronchialis]|uniref:glycosyltransferase n=1 Tax=Gordonia bronchialis TaxID=2054 RepID=UPI00226DD4D4|nr:glycosyltransferase family A protein [Gordonia bronchialis]